MRTPDFWQEDGLLTSLLEPLGRLYGFATAWRLATKSSWRAPVPVVCVGNLVAGGAGKTPLALAVAQHLHCVGLQPMFLARGYGGTIRGPLQVARERDRAEHVGDEGLILAAHAPTIIARNRQDGARLAVALGAQMIIMDDGHQDASLHKDITFVVIDGTYGFGNKRLLPAGPLREPVERGLARASAIVVIVENYDCYTFKKYLPSQLPVLQAYFVPGPESVLLVGRRVVAFAGIAHPEKFFTTVRASGAHMIACYPFADHQLYTVRAFQMLLDESSRFHALLVTTAKDAVRLSPEQRKNVFVLTVNLAWHYDGEKILDTVLSSVRSGEIKY